MQTGPTFGIWRLAAAFALLPLAVSSSSSPRAAEPAESVRSDRTLVLGLEIDRDQARLVAYAVKPRPYVEPSGPRAARAHGDAADVQLEVVLLGPAGARHVERVDVGPLCLIHGPEAEPHVEGDTIVLHRDSFLIEAPELSGFDRVEVAYHDRDRGELTRRKLATETLDRTRFAPAGGSLGYDDLLFARPARPGERPAPRDTSGTVFWPEDLGDPDVYRIEGDPAEGARRINVVIVPDGYRYGEKALMNTHANAMIAHFRNKTPYKEHDPFINYTLVYAYSVQSGTDQCDCAIELDTAMGTRFPQQVATCGDSANRCLHYGGGCDTDGTSNIIAAELRAPYKDTTILMVNTTRYGGCGGSRATYSAGNASGVEVAVHELGHSLAGLADEYDGTASCGGFAGERNTSLNAVDGAWPEWISQLGAPRQGAQYYNQCIYRPVTNCEMRALDQPFCAVCNQRWSLVTFGQFRVAPTAPVESSSPPSTVAAMTGVPVAFSAATRLSVGASVTNSFTWTLTGPGYPVPTVVATGTASHERSFQDLGQYQLALEVVADTNFVKPVRYGANRDTVTWTIDVSPLAPPSEVAGPGTIAPLKFTNRQTLAWEDHTSSSTYNLYRGDLALLGAGYGSCSQPDLGENTASETATPPAGTGWFYLVTGENPAGEGPMGQDSSGSPRVNAAPCG